ncbi:AMP-binding protein [Pontibacter harenae]|uniref:AMP-binding protein n=1 Tax=Pontibacter harenae TaxID=2894083 RepID=UPI001E4A29BC|nr:AMP-binding protein [Pontibacter harenae]MCC9165508.1 AMP-binding protein [Pontibacter harenae]
MSEKHLFLNGKKFYYDELVNYSFRNSIPLNGYESKTLEFCRNWLNGVQEFPMQTSGSTGPPQTINLTRKQLEASARRTIKLLNLQAGDTMLVCLNTEYIAGIMMLVRGFIADMAMIVVEPSSHPFSEVPAEVNIDFASFVPLQLQTMLEQTPDLLPRLNQMKGMLVGGAPVSTTLQRELQRVTAPVYHTYGMTETASHIAVRLLNGPDAAAYYTVFDGIKVGIDNRGCLTIRGDVTNNEEQKTNDIVELLTPTSFRWVGRADNTINTGGVKVQLEKVEVAIAEVLANTQNNRRFFVNSQPDEFLGDKLILIIEGEKLTPEEEKQLLQEVRSRLTKFEMPRVVYYSPKFSETATGKISKQRTMQKLGLPT